MFLNNNLILLVFKKPYKILCPTGFRKCSTEFHFFRTSCPAGLEKLFAALYIVILLI